MVYNEKMKQYIFLAIAALLFLAGFIYVRFNAVVPEPAFNENTAPQEAAQEIGQGQWKFSGEIVDFRYWCYADGSCEVLVGGRWVQYMSGLTAQGGPLGRVIGMDFYSKDNLSEYIGRKVEVYGKQIGENQFTIFGDKDYYIKSLEP